MANNQPTIQDVLHAWSEAFTMLALLQDDIVYYAAQEQPMASGWIDQYRAPVMEHMHSTINFAVLHTTNIRNADTLARRATEARIDLRVDAAQRGLT